MTAYFWKLGRMSLKHGQASGPRAALEQGRDKPSLGKYLCVWARSRPGRRRRRICSQLQRSCTRQKRARGRPMVMIIEALHARHTRNRTPTASRCSGQHRGRGVPPYGGDLRQGVKGGRRKTVPFRTRRPHTTARSGLISSPPGNTLCGGLGIHDICGRADSGERTSTKMAEHYAHGTMMTNILQREAVSGAY